MDSDNSESENISLVNLPSEILDLIQEYGDIFESPKALPPNRRIDHAINLKGDQRPINVRPYKYAHAQKDDGKIDH